MSVLGRLCFLICTTIASCNPPPINLIFLGNPGVGKSSLLNQLHNEAAFAAGINIGGGMTTQTKVAPTFLHEGRQVRLIDTPGLADSKMRKEASEQITQGLRQGDDYKMVFVVKEEAGRVVDQDRTTIRLILESVHGIDLQNNYAIIVNKVDEQTMPRMEAEFDTFTTLLMEGFPYTTGQVLLLPEDSRLKNKDNVVLPSQDKLTEQVVKFLELVPPVHIPKEAAKAIAYEKYDVVRDQMIGENKELVALMQSMMQSIQDKQEKSDDKHAALMERLMEAQRENANEKVQMLKELMESQRANAEYMERMRSEQAAREAKRQEDAIKMAQRQQFDAESRNQALKDRVLELTTSGKR